MLYLIGTGLHDWKDISLRGIETLEKCEKIFFDTYTSSQDIRIKKLEKHIGKKIKKLTRKDLEDSDTIFSKKDTALLVMGDPLVATTHYDIIKTAQEKNIKTKVMHSSSIISAVCETGLHIYKFGKTTSIPFVSKDFKPKSPCKTIEQNLSIGAHTMVLLDIGMESVEATNYLLENCESVDEKTKAFVCADLGGESIIVSGTLGDLKKNKIKKQPQTIIIPAQMHFTEKDCFNEFRK